MPLLVAVLLESCRVASVSCAESFGRRKLFAARYLLPIQWYLLPMALNIKDPEVDRLADELATRMGHNNKTQAIRDALRAQLSLLEARNGDRVAHLLDVMSTEIWPLLPAQPPVTKAEREHILGYDPEVGA